MQMHQIKNARSDYHFKLRQGFSKDKRKGKAYAVRGHDSYIGATINCGDPQQHFAQGAPTSTTIHSTSKP